MGNHQQFERSFLFQFSCCKVFVFDSAPFLAARSILLVKYNTSRCKMPHLKCNAVLAKLEYNIAMMTKTNISSPKSDVRKRVRELRVSDLFMTMSEIGQKVNISRQRVFQILKEEGLPTRRKIRKFLYECPVCDTISATKFCSLACKKQWQRIPIVCTRCGKLFYSNRHQFFISYPHHNKGLFCSKVCTGKGFAEHYGFERYPDHSSTSKKAPQDKS